MARVILKNINGEPHTYEGVSVIKLTNAAPGGGYVDFVEDGQSSLGVVEVTLDDYIEHFEEYSQTENFYLVDGQEIVNAREEAR